jgi:hypothetical protein
MNIEQVIKELEAEQTRIAKALDALEALRGTAGSGKSGQPQPKHRMSASTSRKLFIGAESALGKGSQRPATSRHESSQGKYQAEDDVASSKGKTSGCLREEPSWLETQALTTARGGDLELLVFQPRGQDHGAHRTGGLPPF